MSEGQQARRSPEEIEAIEQIKKDLSFLNEPLRSIAVFSAIQEYDMKKAKQGRERRKWWIHEIDTHEMADEQIQSDYFPVIETKPGDVILSASEVERVREILELHVNMGDAQFEEALELLNRGRLG